jgi:hypothetical protein
VYELLLIEVARSRPSPRCPSRSAERSERREVRRVEIERHLEAVLRRDTIAELLVELALPMR